MIEALTVGCLMAAARSGACAIAADTESRSRDISTGPGWEGHRNRLLAEPLPTPRQHFSYRTTNHAGGGRPGEVGGRIGRSLTPKLVYPGDTDPDPRRSPRRLGPVRRYRRGGSSEALHSLARRARRLARLIGERSIPLA